MPPYGEHDYRVSAVAGDRIQSDLTTAVRVTYKDLLAPPVPATARLR